MDAIVAIFIKGNQYQFSNLEKDWRVKNIAELFKKIKGYLL